MGSISLLNRVVRQRKERSEAPAIVVWFNACMHDAAQASARRWPPTWPGTLPACRDPLIRLWHPLPTSMLSPQEQTRRKMWLAGVALVIAIGIYFLAHGLIGPSLTEMAKVQAALGPAWPAGSWWPGG